VESGEELPVPMKTESLICAKRENGIKKRRAILENIS
jgi:hypothetical protein